MQMHLCNSCSLYAAQQYCRCSDPPVKLCEGCVGKHHASDLKRCHELLPIETLPYINVPGYAEAFKARTGQRKAAAVEELLGNLQLLKQWKSDLKAMHDNLLTVVSQHWERQERELSAFHSSLEAAIQAGIQEADNTYIDPNPVLTSPIAKGIRHFQPGLFHLVNTSTKLELYEKSFRDLVSAVVFVIELQPLDAMAELAAFESGTIRVVRNSTSERTTIRQHETHLQPSCEEKETSNKPHQQTTVETGWTMPKPDDCRATPVSSSDNTSWKRVVCLASTVICLAGVLFSVMPDVWCNTDSHQSVDFRCDCTLLNQTRRLSDFSLGFVSEDSVSYSGEWANGGKPGNGMLITTDGCIYEGQWVNDIKQGFGLLTNPDNFTYEGTWRNDKRDGIGIETYEVVSASKEVMRVSFIGEFSSNQRHGLGIQFLNGAPSFYGFWNSAGPFDSSPLTEKLHLSGQVGCKSANEYRTVFEVKSGNWVPVRDAEVWTFSSGKEVYLAGLLFTRNKHDGYMESMEIYRGEEAAENLIYEHPAIEHIERSLSPVSFPSAIHVLANTPYIVKTKFDNARGNLGEIDTSQVEGEVKFEVNGGNREFTAPQHFRGFMYRLTCEDSRIR